MTDDRQGPRNCSIARTLDVVGEKWALLVIREIFLGNRRFDEMIRRTGAPRDTLTARLKSLVAAGILERRLVSEHPPRHEYRLTNAGRDLYPILVTMIEWGDRYRPGEDGPPMTLVHHCGHTLGAVMACSSCGEEVRAREVRALPRRDTAASIH